VRHAGNAIQLRHRIEGRLHILETGPDRHRIFRHQQRVAVRVGGRDIPPSQQAARTGHVLDDNRLPKLLAKRAGHHAGDHIGRATRREADDELDRAGWVVGSRLCRRNTWSAKNGTGDQNRQQMTHIGFLLPVLLFFCSIDGSLSGRHLRIIRA